MSPAHISRRFAEIALAVFVFTRVLNFVGLAVVFDTGVCWYCL